MYKYLSAFFFVFISNYGYAADGDVVWFFQSFTDVSLTVSTDMNVNNALRSLCTKKANVDLTSATQPEQSSDDTAFGHTLGGFVTVNKSSETLAQCVYNSGPENNDNLYYLYIYAESACSGDQQFDRIKRTCSVKPTCTVGEKYLLSGFSSTLVQTAPFTTYIADQTPNSVCHKTPDLSIACTYNKPSRSHSCYSDSPLSWDGENLSGSYTGHCNYEFENTGTSCVIDSSVGELPKAWGGYLMSKASNGGEFSCAPGIEGPGCTPDPGTGGDTGGDTGGGSDGGSGGNTGGGTGGDGGGDGDDGGDDGGGGTSPGSGTPGSASGTACGSSLMCSGDAIQCAILAQEKKTACALTDLTKVDQTALANMLTGDKFQLEEKTVQATSLFERARFLPSGCPAPETLSLSYGSFTIPYDFLCNFVDKFSFLLVLMASFFAMLIVFKD